MTPILNISTLSILGNITGLRHTTVSQSWVAWVRVRVQDSVPLPKPRPVPVGKGFDYGYEYLLNHLLNHQITGATVPQAPRHHPPGPPHPLLPRLPVPLD